MAPVENSSDRTQALPRPPAGSPAPAQPSQPGEEPTQRWG
jgi:hypothetical protein